jgi:hypothetical protein
MKVLPKRYPGISSELVMFTTALLATQKLDLNYLLSRAREQGTEKEIIEIIEVIDQTFSSKNPEVEDILTLYELRERYARLYKSIPRTTRAISTGHEKPPHVSIGPNQVVEYAGKQLGLKG